VDVDQYVTLAHGPNVEEESEKKRKVTIEASCPFENT
jgi:hypothetical protein